MNDQEARDIPKVVGVCIGIMGAMFVVVYAGIVTLLHFYPAVESVVG